MKSDVLDIIFENRNKAYGAYDLRRSYQNRLYKAMAIMLAVAALLCCLTLIKTNKKAEAIMYTDGPVLIPYCPVKPAAKPAAPKQAITITPKVVRQNPGNKITFVKDSLQKISEPATAVVAAAASTAVSASTLVTATGGLVTGTADGKSTTNSVDVNTPTLSPDVYPSFPGGDGALRKFLEANLRTPPDMPDDASISVQVEFVVGFDGKLKGFTIIKDGGDDFNNEVIRVLKKMPYWIPGKSKGQNVSVYHIIPVKFVSENANP